MSIKDLIERVEKATGADEDIDAEVWCQMFAPDVVAIDFGARFPLYTASVDAVIGLIGERIGDDEAEWFVEVPSADGFYRAGVRSHTGTPFDYARGAAPTPALALLLAFLKAWEARDA